MKKMIFKLLALSIICSFFINRAHAQEGTFDYNIKYHATRVGFKFTHPSGFAEIQNIGRILCWDRKRSITQYYTMINEGGDVKITIGGDWFELPTNKDSLTWINKYKDAYLLTVKIIADTTNENKVKFYDKAYLKQFNADDGGEYYRYCYQGKSEPFTNMRVVFLTNTNVGNKTYPGTGRIDISYIYKDSAKDKIEKIMCETRNMIKFEN